MLPYNLQDINHSIPAAYLARGRDYLRAGRVSGLSISSDGGLIAGLVQGGANRPYKVIARIAGRQGDVHIRGDCSCPIGGNCKHVAAVLLQALQQSPAPQSAAPTLPAKAAQAKGTASTDAQMGDWLTRLESAMAPVTAPTPENSERLLYLIDCKDDFMPSGVGVSLVMVRELKAGGYGKQQNVSTALCHARRRRHFALAAYAQPIFYTQRLSSGGNERRTRATRHACHRALPLADQR